MNEKNQKLAQIAAPTAGQEAWRALSMMSEFVIATEEIKKIGPAVSIFGSARLRPDNPWYARTVEIAKALSEAGFNVVSGGGPGIMEAANKGAQAGGKGLSIGLNMALAHEQHGNPYQDVSLHFRYFFNRKIMFVRSAMVFVVMPGGFGTLDELSEALTLIQTKKSRKIPIILVGSEFWRGFLDWSRQSLMGMGLISEADLALMEVIDDTEEIVKRVKIEHSRDVGEKNAAQPPLILEFD
ncbi:MAG: hypothetical protein RLZZ502_1852 [Pseudomonadota bacterium]